MEEPKPSETPPADALVILLNGALEMLGGRGNQGDAANAIRAAVAIIRDPARQPI